MYEIDLSTLLLIGVSDFKTKIITKEKEFYVDCACKDIINHSCNYFGQSLSSRIKMTKNLVKYSTKVPIIIEDTRSIIFFPLRSVREKNNIWISFNNLSNIVSENGHVVLNFVGNKSVCLDYSYYIIDNQITRCMFLDYELKKRRKSLEK